jgi:predicted 3-demethylubiquinone-9 3-methyltransferase (glyoxalase superfamily)
MTLTKITPCLWFDGRAREAADLYVSLFPRSKILAASAQVVEFSLDGQRFQALDGGPQYRFTEALSLSIACRDAEEVDHYWNGLLADGGEEGRCGWLKDRFGVSWQVVPDGLGELLSGPDRNRAGRALRAMMGMRKLDLAAMRAAADKAGDDQ